MGHDTLNMFQFFSVRGAGTGVERFWGASRRFAPTAVYAHFKVCYFIIIPCLILAEICIKDFGLCKF